MAVSVMLGLRHQRHTEVRALFHTYIAFGMLYGSWWACYPVLATVLRVPAPVVAVIILAPSAISAIIQAKFASHIAEQWGAAHTIRRACIGMSAGLAVVGLTATVGSQRLLPAGLVLAGVLGGLLVFGTHGALWEVAMNIKADEIEKSRAARNGLRAIRKLIPRFFGAQGVGTTIAAALMTLFIAILDNAIVMAPMVFGLVIYLWLRTTSGALDGTSHQPNLTVQEKPNHHKQFRNMPGLIQAGAASALAEGLFTDWPTQALVSDSYRLSPAVATGWLTLFYLAMTAHRFIDFSTLRPGRFRPRRVVRLLRLMRPCPAASIRVDALFTAASAALIWAGAHVGHPTWSVAAAYAAALCAGWGVALLIPRVISAAGAEGFTRTVQGAAGANGRVPTHHVRVSLTTAVDAYETSKTSLKVGRVIMATTLGFMCTSVLMGVFTALGVSIPAAVAISGLTAAAVLAIRASVVGSELADFISSIHHTTRAKASALATAIAGQRPSFSWATIETTMATATTLGPLPTRPVVVVSQRQADPEPDDIITDLRPYDVSPLIVAEPTEAAVLAK